MKKGYLKLISAVLALCVTLPLLGDTSNGAETDTDFPHVLQVELGSSDFASGDSITIQEVRGDTDEIRAGGTYCVTGTYTLASEDEADLSFFATTTNPAPTPIDPKQTVRVKKGAGSFRLIKKMTDMGDLHLTFYSRASGQGFGGVYFGQGQWVLREKKFSYRHAAAQRQDYISHEPVSTSGPNQVLFNYLGDPVAPPTDMDAAYTKDGLTSGMESAARDAGVSLVKLEIDDSEFPFLVGVVFAEKGDKEKLMKQIEKNKAYAHSGGVGGETTYAMSLVPNRTFPPEVSDRIYHRLMLREAVLCDKISTRR